MLIDRIGRLIKQEKIIERWGEGGKCRLHSASFWPYEDFRKTPLMHFLFKSGISKNSSRLASSTATSSHGPFVGSPRADKIMGHYCGCLAHAHKDIRSLFGLCLPGRTLYHQELEYNPDVGPNSTKIIRRVCFSSG